MKKKVVELRQMGDDMKEWTSARFVLGDSGVVEVVGVTPNGRGLALDLIKSGIRGAGRVLQPTDGLLFLQYLSQEFRGDRLWATPVMDMDLAEDAP